MIRRSALLGQGEDNETWLNVLLCVLVVIFAFLLFTKYFWLQPIEVEGSSMNMTLYTRDVVLMDKLAKPQRGDVVIVKVTESTRYIKRLIGLPGDRIYSDEEGFVYRVTDGVTTRLDEPYAYFLFGYKKGTYKDRDYRTFDVTLSSDEIFVMGDNRWNSNDSRARVNQFKYESILGVVHQWVIDERYSLGWIYQYI